MAKKTRPVRIPNELAEHKGFAKLAEFARMVGEKEGCDWTCALSGLQLSDRPERDRYDGDPANTTPFARMGCDGVHYSFLQIDGKVRDDSPVVQINPMDADDAFAIVGADLTEFIGWEVHSQRALSKMMLAEGDEDEAASLAEEGVLLERLAAAFNVKPWGGHSSARYRELQRLYLPDLAIDFEKLPWLKRMRRFRR